ncbi:aminotransferase class I/II-fold pyridoxal phosphate-dependent enzyme [Hylemonella gracilis]|jgi:histidinol-phosphate aminotransferase|uniref:Histidinol-phosphate aminotransferase n=1 Tax=Hylemonella gracilis TaxID=80880 RepID=A0A4P6UFF0_9BURK|nr:aminotransferase class I/II-fold pyridoxal phosphate-dependent enzyme [Hylemonella gracilis]QBK03918.1 aminotransferase class I/II-fold pyridoxal phosphate-dependent enzyme [Hylemonella gracilis]
MNTSPDLLMSLARPQARGLPDYNAGLSPATVRQRYGLSPEQPLACLASNENPFGASLAVGRVLAELALSGEFSRYPDARCSALRAAIAAGTGVAPERLVFGNGSEDLLKLLCEVFLQPGDRVLTQRPAFGLHEIYPRMMGAELELLELTEAMTFDVDAWCTALARGPKLAFVPNPSNPVGCAFDQAAMKRLLAATPAHTVLVLDEAYYEYARLEPDYPEVLDLLRARSGPWIVLRTFSKAWGLAGLRVGYGMASDAALVALLDKVRSPFNVNHAAQCAALAAWNDAAHMQASVARTVLLREALVVRLQALVQPGRPGQALAGLRIAPSVANFLFLDLGHPSGPVAEALLAHGVIVKPWKEPGFTHCLRVSIGTEDDNLRFVQALLQVLDDIPEPAHAQVA